VLLPHIEVEIKQLSILEPIPPGCALAKEMKIAPAPIGIGVPCSHIKTEVLVIGFEWTHS